MNIQAMFGYMLKMQGKEPPLSMIWTPQGEEKCFAAIVENGRVGEIREFKNKIAADQFISQLRVPHTP